jgi:death-on-curing protein
MTRYITFDDVVIISHAIMQQSGGSVELRNRHALEAAIAQPRATFDGNDLYPTIVAKAGALAFGLIQNHPFLDGNKRIGHAAMEVFLILNGYEIAASVEEQERIILDIAASRSTRDDLIHWIETHIIIRP